MPVQLSDVFDFYQFPVGRAIFALRQVGPFAKKLDAPAIEALVKQALDTAIVVRDTEVRFRSQAAVPAYGPEAVARDQQADRTSSAFDSAIQAALDIQQGTETAAFRAAETLAREAFPRGVGAVTSMTYVEEHSFLEGLLQRLEKDGDLAQEVATLCLAPFVQRLREVTTALGKALIRNAQGPTWDEIRSARAGMQQALLRVVAATVGQYHDDSDRSVQARTALLGPLMVQQQAIRAALKGRRGAPADVDPETGVELPETPLTA